MELKLYNKEQEFTITFDEEDYELISKYNWSIEKAHNTYYAKAHYYKDGKRTLLRMHRLLAGITDPSIKVDHKDRNGLNNRRSNLRVTSHAKNMQNKCSATNSSSQYKGVSRRVRGGKVLWEFNIKKGGKSTSMAFSTELEGAIAYNIMADKLFGEYACLNNVKYSRELYNSAYKKLLEGGKLSWVELNK